MISQPNDDPEAVLARDRRTVAGASAAERAARLYRAVNGPLAERGSLDGGGPTVADGMLFVASGYSRFGRKTGSVLLAFTPGGR